METIVGGPNIMYQDENLGINTTRDEMKKKARRYQKSVISFDYRYNNGPYKRCYFL